MAFEVNLQTVSVPASADLSTKQFLFGTINASGQVAVTGAGLATASSHSVPARRVAPAGWRPSPVKSRE
jgi:hypothetical protein